MCVCQKGRWLCLVHEELCQYWPTDSLQGPAQKSCDRIEFGVAIYLNSFDNLSISITEMMESTTAYKVLAEPKIMRGYTPTVLSEGLHILATILQCLGCIILVIALATSVILHIVFR